MNKKLLILILVIGLLLTGCGSKSKEKVEEAAITPVEIVELTRGTIKNDYIYSGQINPSEQVNVLSKLTGKVSDVNYEVGAVVSQGSILFTIDNTDINNSINVLMAQLASAEAATTSAKVNANAGMANGSIMQSQISAAKANVDQLKISLDSAKIRYDNNKSLYDNGYIANQEYKQYEDAYNQALISYEQADKSYKILRDTTSLENDAKAKSSIEQAESTKLSISAQIESQKDSLRDTIVTSPISGVVTACNVTKGALLSNALTPFSIAKIDVVTIDVNVSEQNINAIAVGQVVDVEVATLSSDNLSGKISIINPVATSAGTYEVKIEINNSANLLKPGMFGQVHFVKEQSDNALVITRNAVIGSESDKYVFVEENGIVKKVIVTTGIDNGKEIEIISGLSENQHIIVKGQTYIKDGDAVQTAISATKGE